MSDFIATAYNYIVLGIQIGLVAGTLAGAITWSIMKTPNSLFRGILGLAVGIIGFLLFRGQEIARLWGRIAAAAGGAIPRGITASVLDVFYDAIVAGLIGMAIVLGISSPANTLRGALFGGMLGIILGIILVIIIRLTGLPIDSIFYSPMVGIAVLAIFAVVGSGSNSQ